MRKKTVGSATTLFITVIAAAAAFLTPAAVRAQSLSGWSLVWSDEFNGASLDTSKWKLELNEGDPGIAVYTARSQNLFVSNGCLVLQTQKENYSGKQYTSTQISSRNRGYWKYCRIDVRAKLPYGQGIWPAIWMMPNNPAYGGWPRSGEIDIMENLGNNTRLLYTTLHYGDSKQSIQGTYTVPANATLADSFHVYTMIWDSGSFAFYLDSAHNYWNTKNWSPDNVAFPKPFDQAFFMIFDLAVGGSWGGPPDSTTVFPQQMLVDWIHVYKRLNTGVTQKPEAIQWGDGVPVTVTGRTICVELKNGAPMTLNIFNAAGRKIICLADGFRSAGRFSFSFPSTTSLNGIYLWELETNGKKTAGKIAPR